MRREAEGVFGGTNDFGYEDAPLGGFDNAHPGEYTTFMEHLARMQKYENAYLDISGTGLFRYGMLRYGIDKVGQTEACSVRTILSAMQGCIRAVYCSKR